jgi:3-oxoacyl-[acyl-carrier protein] reductase
VTLASRTTRAQELEARGANWVPCDASDPQACKALVASCEPIDALVISAGPYHRVPFFQETAQGWRSMFSNNLDPVFFLGQAVLPGMRDRGWGRILTFSMANAHKLQANPRVAAHYVAKTGVIALTRTLARVGASRGVTANCISPGFVDSGSAPPEELASMVPKIPAGRVGSVDDVVALARFLLSEEASYINGADVPVSGAWGL